MRRTTAIITGARDEFTPFILDSARRILGPEESPFLIKQRFAEEALTYSGIMPPEEQYVIRDVIRTKAQFAWRDGARTCLIVGYIARSVIEEEFDECVERIRSEIYEVDEWHLFGDIYLACLTPAPEMILL